MAGSVIKFYQIQIRNSSIAQALCVFLSTVSCLSVKHGISHGSYLNLIKRFSSSKVYKILHL